jgi:hypothetical protein
MRRGRGIADLEERDRTIRVSATSWTTTPVPVSGGTGKAMYGIENEIDRSVGRPRRTPCPTA